MSTTRPESPTEPGRRRPKTRRPRGFPVLAGRAGPSPIDGERILPMKSAPRSAISPPFASSREAHQLDERLIPDNPEIIARVSVFAKKSFSLCSKAVGGQAGDDL